MTMAQNLVQGNNERIKSITIPPWDTGSTAAEVLRDKRISCIAVIADEDNQDVMRMITERDIPEWISRASTQTCFQKGKDIMTSYETITSSGICLRDMIGITQFVGVTDAMQIMFQQHVSCLIVIADDDDETLVGIISERDIVAWICQASPDKRPRTVRDVMTRDVVFCHFDTPVDECRAIMKENSIRHLPVLENGAVMGMVSVWDLLEARSEELPAEVGSSRESRDPRT